MGDNERPSELTGRETIARNSIVGWELPTQAEEKPKSFKGRISVWPGVLLLFVIALAAVGLVVYYGNETFRDRKDIQRQFYENAGKRRRIKGGNGGIGEDLVGDNGEVGNPTKYPPSECALPNYLSDNGKVYVQNPKTGEKVPISFKGVNWFGMETGQAIPFGLWDNYYNGTTAYEIASFLARNKFNGVRLPIRITSLLQNVKPEQSFINTATNRAIPSKTFRGMLQGITKALGYRKISIMISLHTLSPSDNGDLWYSSAVPVSDMFKAIDILADTLCDSEHFNVMGLDLKNEPHGATWGSGAKNDFRIGATELGNRMLKACPQWITFIEGVNRAHVVQAPGGAISYYDWFGGGLQDVGDAPLELDIDNKVIYAPHYYNPAVYPQLFLYESGKLGAGGLINNFVELSDTELKRRVDVTAEHMFGYLRNRKKEAIVLGEFAGLHTKDKHPLKTIQRINDACVQFIKEPGYAGGFMWSLNPESGYDFNPSDTRGRFVEGLLNQDWHSVNQKFLDAMSPLDSMQDLRMLPCFPK